MPSIFFKCSLLPMSISISVIDFIISFSALGKLRFLLMSYDALYQWFSTFLVERNPNETFQRLKEPLCSNLIVLCKKHHLINKMRLKYSCSDLFTIKILIQTVKNLMKNLSLMFFAKLF